MNNKNGWRHGILITALFLSGAVHSQTKITEHVYRLDEGVERPAASLDDVAILIGAWRGEAFGSVLEETWNPPSAGTMVGMFKLYDGDAVTFYELMLLVEEEGSVSMKVKHFNPDFTAWEDKADYVTFKFVSADDDALFFSGLSFYRLSGDEMVGYLAMRNDGELREEKLTFRRVDPAE